MEQPILIGLLLTCLLLTLYVVFRGPIKTFLTKVFGREGMVIKAEIIRVEDNMYPITLLQIALPVGIHGKSFYAEIPYAEQRLKEGVTVRFWPSKTLISTEYVPYRTYRRNGTVNVRMEARNRWRLDKYRIIE